MGRILFSWNCTNLPFVVQSKTREAVVCKANVFCLFLEADPWFMILPPIIAELGQLACLFRIMYSHSELFFFLVALERKEKAAIYRMLILFWIFYVHYLI